MSFRRQNRSQKSYIIEEIQEHGILLDEREVFLHGYISASEDDPGTDYRNANIFIKNIRLLQIIDKEKPIIIHQHNIGGNWNEGVAIYDMINSCQAPVIMVCHGTAMSMGSIILQAADTRILMPNCNFMAHDGTTGINEEMTHRQSSAWQKYENKQHAVMLDIYTNVCQNGQFFKTKKCTRATVKKFIKTQMQTNEDWILSAREAISYGFADAVLGDNKYETIEEIKSDWE